MDETKTYEKFYSKMLDWFAHHEQAKKDFLEFAKGELSEDLFEELQADMM